MTGPVALTRRFADGDAYETAVATDGHDFLVAWSFGSLFSDPPTDGVRFARVAPDGTFLDATFVTPYSRRMPSSCRRTGLIGAGHDGADYWIAFSDANFCRYKATVYLQRVHRDGSFGKPKRVLKLKSIPWQFACHPGGCLMAWVDLRPEGVTPDGGKFICGAWSVPFAGETAASSPKRIATDLVGIWDLAFGLGQYLALGTRRHVCVPGEGTCRSEIAVLRLDPHGDPLDADVRVASNIPPEERATPWGGGLAFDGAGWVASYQLGAVHDTGFHDGSFVFVNRVAPDGTPQAAEPVGLLVDDGGRASLSRVASTATHTVIVYEDGLGESLEGLNGAPKMTGHVAQRMFPRDPGPEFPELQIVAIGTRFVAEGDRLRFRVAAPGMDPAAVSITATGLPPGAYFDPGTRLFQWRPRGDQAGTHGGVTFQATDGSSTANETLSLVVSEAVPSVSGTVRLADGSPFPGAVLRIRGTADRVRTVHTDAAGRYRIEGLLPGRKVVISLARPTARTHRSAPRAIKLLATGGDLAAPDLVLTPR